MYGEIMCGLCGGLGGREAQLGIPGKLNLSYRSRRTSVKDREPATGGAQEQDMVAKSAITGETA